MPWRTDVSVTSPSGTSGEGGAVLTAGGGCGAALRGNAAQRVPLVNWDCLIQEEKDSLKDH